MKKLPQRIAILLLSLAAIYYVMHTQVVTNFYVKLLQQQDETAQTPKSHGYEALFDKQTEVDLYQQNNNSADVK